MRDDENLHERSLEENKPLSGNKTLMRKSEGVMLIIKPLMKYAILYLIIFWGL